MTDESKQLLDELSNAIERMPNNPRGVAGWLLSNYRFQKIGDAQPVEKFHQKPTRQAQEHQLKVADNPVQTLLARTDAYKGIQQTQAKLGGGGKGTVRQNKLAQMARGIAEISVEDEAFNAPEPEYDDENLENDELPEERGPKRSRELVTGASLVDSNTPPLTPDEVEMLAGAVHESSQEDLQEALRLQRLKRVKAQQAVLGGGSGAFRRT